MDFSTAEVDQNEQKQFLEAFEENIELLLELLEAVRSESVNTDDTMAAEFMTGLSHLVRVFRRTHRLQARTALGQFGVAAWSRETNGPDDLAGFTVHETE